MRTQIMDRIDRLQGAVEGLRDDSRVNWATAENAVDKTKALRIDVDGLHDIIRAMERRHQTLANMVEELRNPPRPH